MRESQTLSDIVLSKYAIKTRQMLAQYLEGPQMIRLHGTALNN